MHLAGKDLSSGSVLQVYQDDPRQMQQAGGANVRRRTVNVKNLLPGQV